MVSLDFLRIYYKHLLSVLLDGFHIFQIEILQVWSQPHKINKNIFIMQGKIKYPYPNTKPLICSESFQEKRL